MQRSSLIFSAGMHVAVFAAAVIGMPLLPQRIPDEVPPIIPVELAQIAEKTNPPPPAPPKPAEKKPEPKPEPPKPEPVRAAPPPPPPPPQVEAAPKQELPPPKPVEAKPEPLPAPKPEPKKEVAEATPPAPPAPKPRAKPEPPKKVEAPPPPDTKQFDADRLAALLNRMQKTSAPAPQTEPPVKTAAASPAPPSPNQARLDEPMTISELDAIRQQYERCWSPPAGARDASNLVIRIRVALNPDGSLKSAPEIIDRSRFGDDFWRAAAESAQRAVHRCSPLRNLPPTKYERWRDIELTFNPKDMLG